MPQYKRPNRGYDFGGYRDAILGLLDMAIDMEHLLVLNDSIWFPVTPESTLIQRLMDEPSDLTGPVVRKYPRKQRSNHVQSYMFMFKRRVLKDPRFRRFWQRLSFFDDKIQVIERCEKRMSHAISKLGYSFSGLYSNGAMMEALSDMSKDTAAYLVEYEARIAPERSDAIRAAFANASGRIGDYPDFLSAMRELRAFEYILKAHPGFLLNDLGLSFLKKDRRPEYRGQRATLIHSELADQMHPVVLKEIISRDDATHEQ